MTQEEIKKRIDEIKEIASDDEAAHGSEDDLLWDFVTFVAERDDELGQMAKLVLTSGDISFARWCA